MRDGGQLIVVSDRIGKKSANLVSPFFKMSTVIDEDLIKEVHDKLTHNLNPSLYKIGLIGLNIIPHLLFSVGSS